MMKKFRFILSDWSDFHITDSLSVVLHAFARHILTSLSVDEMLVSRYVNWPINSRGLPLRVEMAPFCLKHIYCFICISIEANASCCLLWTMQQKFGLSRCIGEKRLVICVVFICHSFCGILPASIFNVNPFSFIRSIYFLST